MASNQNKRGQSAGGVPYSTYMFAVDYYINKALGKTPTPKQKEAIDIISGSDKKTAKAEAAKEVSARKVGVAPVDKLKSIPSETKPTPKRKPSRASTADTKTSSESKPSRPSTVDTKSKSLGRRIGESLMKTMGEKRSYEQATKDRKANEEMEREMMGKKKGGMVKKKKGGMASRTLRTNTKAGFTRRGCSKG